MTTKNRNTVMDDLEKKDRNYGPWMIVERKSRWKFRENVQNSLEKVGPNAEPRSNLNSINENLQVTKELINCLGLGDSPDVQARDLLDILVPDSVAQHNSVAAIVTIDPLRWQDCKATLTPRWISISKARLQLFGKI
ncbi:hypothetical protein Gogos_009310 [Gossypium gossypioides]|uniref:Uncharacterized protein n=1 Tax=Gossypium gossypioides TaxID=34282 RepID=A0A7J9CEF5_GOSGO|nr:hypothetical protein [Gossypium gossypioides]